MQFIDFIKSPNKKILIDNNLSDGNNITKLFSLSNKISISNYEIFNINLLAKSLLLSNPKYKYINNEQSTYLFYSFLDNKRDGSDLYNLIPDSSFSFESVKVSLSTINEIRKGKRKEESKNKNIDNLIKDYESYLISNSYYDEILMLKEVIKISNIDLIKNVLKIKDKYIIGIVDTYLDQLSYLERLFLDTLINKLNTSYETLTLFTENKNLSIYSYKTYGFYQEVENVINIINQNKLSVSDVEIIISDNKYSNSIKAYFDNYNIPYVFTNGIPIKCFDLYGFIDSILDFFINHYSINCLYDIYRSLALSSKYKYIEGLKDLHADKEAIKVIVNNKNNYYNWSDNQKKFILDLLNLDVSNNVYEIYLRLLELISEYCEKDFIEPLLGTLNNKINIIELCSKLNIDEHPFKLIRRIFEDVKIAVKPLDKACISIRKLSKVTNFYKKYVFILGLSSSQLKQKEIESPLLSDEDISKLIDIDNYYVNLPSLNNIRFNNNLDRLMKFNNNPHIYLSYSEYDSNEYKCLSSSTFYNKYKVNEATPIINSNLSLKMKEITNLDEKIIDDSSFNNIKDIDHLSPTSLNNLYKCPLLYIYSNYYNEISLDEYDNTWLKANESGSLAHFILEKYYKEHDDKKYDEDSFNSIFKECVDRTINNHPFDNKDEIKQELDTIYKITNQYVINNSNVDDYKVLGCELKFKELLITFNDKKYYFKGSVDRVDYLLDPNNILHIKVYDYKTGKELTIKKDGLTQSFIYVKAVEDYLSKNFNSIKSSVGNFNLDDVIYEFHYVYLFSNLDKVIEDRDNNYLANASKLKLFNELDNNVTSFFNIYNPILGKEKKEQGSNKCSYCKYKNKCLLKRHSSLNMYWSDSNNDDND